MPKKFIIKDEDGKQFEVTESSDEVEDEDIIHEDKTAKDDEMLTSEEIAALKELAKHSSELIKLLTVEKKEHEATSEDGCDESEIEDEEKEEVIETKDSKQSAGSIEKTKAKDSSDMNREIEIADAWSKRFNAALSKKN